jgi:hypothetical protein
MKSLSLLAMLSVLFCTNKVQAQYDATQPIYTSDNIQSLQGLKQKIGPTIIEWSRPLANNTNLAKYIGAMAINPSNLSEVFFVDNSATPVLYKFNKNNSTETSTGQTFVGASQGTNTGGTLPMLVGETALGVNMMAISSTLNKGYAISKENKLYNFSLTTNAISAGAAITDVAGNAVSFTNAKGGGLMANASNKLTALINIKQADLTYKYYFFEIDPTTAKAKFVKETFMNYNGFDDPTMFLSGAGVTSDGSIYNSLYNGNESSLYKYNKVTNSFDVNLATANQSIGDVSGSGQVAANSGLLAINFTNVTGSYNASEKTTTINWGVYADEPLSKFNVQSSTDGNTFKTVATQTASALNGQFNYKQNVASSNNGFVYYRIAAVRTNNTEKYSAIITVDESNNVKTDITTYPNPASYFFTLKLSEPKAVEMISIVDSRGATLAQIKVGGNVIVSKRINLDQYNLKNGQYFVKVMFTDNQKQTASLTIQR